MIVTPVFFSVLYPSENPNDVKNNVILIVWDGCQRAHLLEMLDSGDLPFLQSFINEGDYVDMELRDVNRFDDGHKTNTKAGHATMLTGYGYSVHGVMANVKFDPVPDGLTVFERLELVDESIETLFIGSKRNVNVYNDLQRTFLVDGIEVPTIVVIPHPEFNETRIIYYGDDRPAGVFHNMRFDLDFLFCKDDLKLGNATDIAIEQLAKNVEDQFFMFLHYKYPDRKGHAKGENSPSYSNSLIELTIELNRLTTTLKNLGIYDRTFIFITTDHGFDEGTKYHYDDPYIWFIANRKLTGELTWQVDVTPTIYDAMNINWTVFTPVIEGRSLLAKFD